MGPVECGRVLLVRHGQTVSNLENRYAGRSDESLTEEGTAQIVALASRLASMEAGVIWCSEVVRAVESAELLGDILQVPIRSDSRLNELGLGPWEGLTQDEVARRYPEAYALWRNRPHQLVLPGRESLAELLSRATASVHDAATLPKPAILVTHVAPIRVVSLSVLDVPLRYYGHLPVANADAILVEPTARRASRFGENECLLSEIRLENEEDFGQRN